MGNLENSIRAIKTKGVDEATKEEMVKTIEKIKDEKKELENMVNIMKEQKQHLVSTFCRRMWRRWFQSNQRFLVRR